MTDDFDADAWHEALDRHRREKDAFLADHDQSPIPPDERAGFAGLDYYPPDPAFRVTARIDRSDAPRSVRMETTRGRTVTDRRVATLRFDLAGAARSLPVYHEEGQQELFLPFSDPTNGTETYEHGRYLDVGVAPDELLARETLVVDFNLAYAPFCAYSDTYDCPIPPAETHLDVPVEAGEKRREDG